MKERVFQTVGRVLGMSPQDINEQSSPETVANWDSLKHMNLVLALEEEFGVTFTDDEIMSMLSVELIIGTLSTRAA
jgi:acyl carrier protein